MSSEQDLATEFSTSRARRKVFRPEAGILATIDQDRHVFKSQAENYSLHTSAEIAGWEFGDDDGGTYVSRTTTKI